MGQLVPGVWEIVRWPGGWVPLSAFAPLPWAPLGFVGSGCGGIDGEAYSSLIGDGDGENGGRLVRLSDFSAGTCSTLGVVYYASMYCYVEGEAEDKAYWLPRLNT